MWVGSLLTPTTRYPTHPFPSATPPAHPQQVTELPGGDHWFRVPGGDAAQQPIDDRLRTSLQSFLTRLKEQAAAGAAGAAGASAAGAAAAEGGESASKVVGRKAGLPRVLGPGDGRDARGGGGGGGAGEPGLGA